MVRLRQLGIKHLQGYGVIEQPRIPRKMRKVILATTLEFQRKQQVFFATCFFPWLTFARSLKLFVEEVSGNLEKRLGRVVLGVAESVPATDDFEKRARHTRLDQRRVQ